MRVFQILTDLRQGGAERLALNIAHNLTKENEVYLILLDNRDDGVYSICSEVEILYCNSIVKPSLNPFKKKTFDEFDQLIENYKPDIIHTHTIEGYWLAAYAIKKGIKYFFHFHNNLQLFNSSLGGFNMNTIRSFFYRKIFYKKLKPFDVTFITISSENQLFYKKHLPKNFNIALLPNAIDFLKFNCLITNRGIDQSLIFITVGRLDNFKNQEFIIRSIALLKRVLAKPMVLYIVGDGFNKQYLIGLSNDLGLKNEIIFTGNINKVEEMLAKSSIYLHAGLNEGAPLAPLEAMASGLPTVVLNTTGMKDIIINNYNGFIVEFLPDNIETSLNEYISAIQNIVLSQFTYDDFSRKAIEVAKKYDIKSYILKLEKMYND